MTLTNILFCGSALIGLVAGLLPALSILKPTLGILNGTLGILNGTLGIIDNTLTIPMNESTAQLLLNGTSNFYGGWDMKTTYNDIISNDDSPGDVEFLLYTREHLTSPIRAHVHDKGTLFGGAFNKSLNTKFMVHGWMNSYKAPFEQVMVEAYLPEFDYNIIAVNWAAAYNIIYPMARYKVMPVGKVVARFIDRMVKEYGLETSNIQLVGHSLGAHVCGVAGSHVTTGKIGYITGLDPAAPLFFVGGDDTLSKKDADFVLIVHSCIPLIGMAEAIGHVDFYANGGSPFQPGCSIDMNCSHARSFEYYAQSIYAPNSFLGTMCGCWINYLDGFCKGNHEVRLNGNTSTKARGSYFFNTKSSAPY